VLAEPLNPSLLDADDQFAACVAYPLRQGTHLDRAVLEPEHRDLVQPSLLGLGRVVLAVWQLLDRALPRLLTHLVELLARPRWCSVFPGSADDGRLRSPPRRDALLGDASKGRMELGVAPVPARGDGDRLVGRHGLVLDREVDGRFKLDDLLQLVELFIAHLVGRRNYGMQIGRSRRFGAHVFVPSWLRWWGEPP